MNFFECIVGAFEILSGRLVRFGEILVLCCNLVKKISNCCGRNPELLPLEKRKFSFRFVSAVQMLISMQFSVLI